MHDDLRRPRVLLADDQIYMLRLMTRLLEANCDVLGAVSDSADLPGAIERLQPEVVVVDLNMPNISGLDACRRIRAATPAVKVIILTAAEDPEIRKVALQVGAAAFVMKMRAAEDLLPAIQDALIN